MEYRIFESLPETSVLLQIEGKKFIIVAATNAYVAVSGKSRSELLNQDIIELFPAGAENAEFSHRLRTSLEMAVSSKVIQNFTEIRYDQPENDNDISSEYHWRTMNIPVLNTEEKVDFIIHTVQDITPEVTRKKIENRFALFQDENQSLKRNAIVLNRQIEEKRLALEKQVGFNNGILEASLNGIYAVEAVRTASGEIIDFVYLFANHVLVSLMQLSSDKIIGRNVLDLLPETKTNGFFDLFCSLLVSKTSHRAEIKFVSPGIDKWFDYTIVPLDENILVVTIIDISEQLAIREDLTRSNDQLSDFAYAASHDLKEPARKMSLFSQQLQESLNGKLTERDEMIFQKMDKTAQRLLSLISDLLHYCELGSGFLMEEEVNLQEIVQSVMEDLEIEINNKNAKIIFHSLPDVRGNKRQLEQLFYNLLSNAIKYTASPETPYIEIQARRITGKEVPAVLNAGSEANYHLITVRDNGIGFDEKEAERIFGMFVRLNKRQDFPGNGIGLSIAMKVARNHKGFLWASGENGKGACFFLAMPA